VLQIFHSHNKKVSKWFANGNFTRTYYFPVLTSESTFVFKLITKITALKHNVSSTNKVKRHVNSNSFKLKRFLLELVRLAAGRDGRQLVSKTNSENRFHLIGAEILRYVDDRLRTLGWISGSVAEEESVEIFGRKVVIPRNEIYPGSAIYQTADLRRINKNNLTIPITVSS
jgi:hypothetical protein